jgi:osmotically-inducible protein OsmY
MSALDIAERAKNCLRASVVNGVSCEFESGVLVLRGLSESFYKKQVAQEAVKRIDGVTRVVNQIQVVSKSK